MKIERVQHIHVLESLILGLVFYAANIRALVIVSAFPLEGAWIEAGIDLVLVLCAFWVLQRSSLLGDYAAVWTKNLPLILFIGFAVLSLFWTIDPAATLSRLSVLVLSSLIAAYLAVRHSLQDILSVLAGFFATLVVLCFVITLVWRDAGMMNFYPYDGAWRGIFWHRNYLGSTMALGALVFLLCAFLSYSTNTKQAAFYVFFYLLSMALVLLSRSVTGLILAVVLQILLVGLGLWLKLHSRMRPLHYWVVGVLAALVLGLVYIKLDFLLGLLNRNSTLSGRASLWVYLFNHVISQRPFLGYGFGAFWVQKTFQVQLRDTLGWLYPVMIGDNGYVDILLQVGFIGFLVFVVAIILAWVRTARFVFYKRTLLALAPLLVMTYVLTTNLTLSYFLETESFIWMLMLAFSFLATPVKTEQGH